MTTLLEVDNRDQWRKWLKENFRHEREIWLVFYKKHTGKISISYEDAVEEAVCFGWIDSIVKRIDDEKFMRKFTPRKDTSRWSESNKKRVIKMIKEKKMTESGLKKVNFCKLFKKETSKSKSKALSIPPFIKEAFTTHKVWENFNNLAPTYKRHYIMWIQSAKKEKTRQKRIEEAVELLGENRKLPLK